MLVVIFTYNREQMLKDLLMDLRGYEVVVIDDGGDNDICHLTLCNQKSKIITTHHEGKRGHWKKWMLARQIALGTKNEYFLFLQDDLCDIDIKTIINLTEQGWEKQAFAVNLLNNNHSGWGHYQKQDQEPFKVNGITFKQCGFVDCIYLTNRVTLESVEIQPVPYSWFDRPNKSSGVGYYMTSQMRLLGASMMLPEKSLAHHGDHESKMHPENSKK